MPEKVREEFLKEAEILLSLRFPQIVQIFGVVSEPNYCLIMEFMSNGLIFSTDLFIKLFYNNFLFLFFRFIV